MLCMLSRDIAFRIAGAQLDCLRQAMAGGHIAVQRIVRGGLIGHGCGLKAEVAKRLMRLRGVANQRNPERVAAVGGILRKPQRLRRIADDDVAISHGLAALGARRVDLDGDADAARHLHRERLRAAHPAEPGSQNDAAAKIA